MTTESVVPMTRREWIKLQTRAASSGNRVPVRNGMTVPVWMTYRCLYCGEYFAKNQAEEHFGMKRADYVSNASGDDMLDITVIS